MDGIQLRDEAVRDRIRAAEEFLDPSRLSNIMLRASTRSDTLQAMFGLGPTEQISY